MKRFIQIVALVVAALLMAQPALANASCPHDISGSDCSAFNCCKHAGGMPSHGVSSDEAMGPMGQMDSTSAGCQMQWHAALPEPGCAIDSSCVSLASPLTLVAPGASNTATGVPLLAQPDLIGAIVLPMRAARSSGVAVAPASAKYVLFRDFRI